MSHSEKNTIADLVRQCLPAPILANQWDVRFVDNFGDVGAELFSGIVYVHSNWLESIFDAKLAQVTRHHPLAVEPVGEVAPALLGSRWPKSRSKRAFLTRAVTIESSFYGGHFTGALTVGEAFIVRTADGGDQYADRDRHLAIEKLAGVVRSKAYLPPDDLTALRNRARQFLIEIDTRYFLDSGKSVLLKSYKRLLPAHNVQALRLYLKRQNSRRRELPLRIARSQCLAAIRDMRREEILNLLLQFAFDVSTSQPITDEAIRFRFAYGADVAIRKWRRSLRRTPRVAGSQKNRR